MKTLLVASLSTAALAAAGLGLPAAHGGIARHLTGSSAHAAGPQHHARAQHGSTAEPDEAVGHIADVLALSHAQREALMEPLAETVAAMRELRHWHDAVAAELSEAQKQTFGRLLVDSIAASLSVPAEGHHGGEND